MKNLNNSTRKTTEYFSRLLIFIIFLGMSAFAQIAQGQTTYKLINGSEMKISGTSNLKDWTMVANSFICDASFKMKSGRVKEISSLNFILPVTSLKSGEDLMDSRTYKTLKEDQFKNIIFKLKEAKVHRRDRIIRATGDLTISGVTNPITLQTTYVLNPDKTITITGAKLIKMSDFKIKAPSFLMGAITTGDDLVIGITLRLTDKTQQTSVITKSQR